MRMEIHHQRPELGRVWKPNGTIRVISLDTRDPMRYRATRMHGEEHGYWHGKLLSHRFPRSDFRGVKHMAFSVTNVCARELWHYRTDSATISSP